MKSFCWPVLTACFWIATSGSTLAVEANRGMPAGVTNTITLTNRSGTAIANYPLQFGRPFLKGVIADAPQVLLNGTRVPTQADIKNRYADGSVEYAVIAVLIPMLPASGSLILSFADQPAPTNTPLTQTQMLSSSYNFDVSLSLSGAAGGTTQTVSARTMLTNGDYRLWTAGPIAQTIELADDTVARKYDIGLGDGYHPFRPRFYATFWPGTHQVWVRVVGENMLTSELEDLAYRFTIRAGQTSPALVYTGDLAGDQNPNPKIHWSMSAWTERFWLGGPPSGQVDIDNNLAYLAAIRFLPNYDPSIRVPASTVAAYYNDAWAAIPHDIFDGQWGSVGGLWSADMSAPGARAEIAPYPQWTVMWLYTGAWQMREMALGMADLAGAFPGHLRESVAGKRLSRADPPGSSTGLGRAVSITDRKSLVAQVLDYYYTSSTDAVSFVGPVALLTSEPPWYFDGAHQPSAFYPQYLVTGDPWYLNEMYLWAGFSAARYNGADTGDSPGRGPTGAEGGIDDQLRGAGWVLRNRAETAFIAPDADPEKAYFTYLTNDALARWEGSMGITGSAYDATPEKVWGAGTGNYYSVDQGPVSGQIPPLGNWDSGGTPQNPANNTAVIVGVNQSVFLPNRIGAVTAPWISWYFDYALGRTVELGFAANRLRLNHGRFMTGMINNSGYPDLIGIYNLPVEANCTNISSPYSAAQPGCTAPPGGYLASWQAVIATLSPAFLTGVNFPPSGNNGYGALPQYFAGGLQDDGRPIWVLPGLAMMIDHHDPGATQAWSWYLPNVYQAINPALLQGDPKWCIVPRTDNNALPLQPTATPPSKNAT